MKLGSTVTRMIVQRCSVAAEVRRLAPAPGPGIDSAKFRTAERIGEKVDQTLRTVDHDELVEKIQTNAVRPLTHEDEADVSTGWAGFHHPLDLDFNRDKVFANEYLLLAYRTDSFKIPSGTLKLRQHEAVLQWLAENGRTTIPRFTRKALLETVRLDLRYETPVTIGAVAVVWNTLTGQVWIWTRSAAGIEQIADLFRATFGLQLLGTGAQETAERLDPEGLERSGATYAELGAGFLAWLWWRSERAEGEPLLEGGAEIRLANRLELDGMPGPSETAYRASDPAEIGEARLGLRSGRFITSGGLELEDGERPFRCTVQAGGLGLSAVKLPNALAKGEEEQFYETMFLLERLDERLREMLVTFLAHRLREGWEQEHESMRRWARAASEAAHTELFKAELKGIEERGLELLDLIAAPRAAVGGEGG